MNGQTIMFIAVLGLICACLGGLLQIYHVFYTVEVDVKKFPALTVAYTSYFGDLEHYRKEIDVVAQQMARLKSEVNFDKMPGFSISYDRLGEQIEKNSHRYVVGKIIPEGIFDEEQRALLLRSKVNITKLDLDKCAYINYPFDSEMALTGGKIRSYPKLLEWVNETKADYFPTSKFIELYYYEPKMVTFILPLGRRRGIFTKYVRL